MQLGISLVKLSQEVRFQATVFVCLFKGCCVLSRVYLSLSVLLIR